MSSSDMARLVIGIVVGVLSIPIFALLMRAVTMEVDDEEAVLVTSFAEGWLAVDDLGYGQTMEVLGMSQFTPFGGGQRVLDRAWDDPDLWKKS